MPGLMRLRQTKIIEIEVPGLGARMEEARKQKKISVSALCREAEISRNYWYDLVEERIKGALEEPTFRRIEAALEADFKVQFND